MTSTKSIKMSEVKKDSIYAKYLLEWRALWIKYLNGLEYWEE